MSGTESTIPPGWYPDEEVPGGQRWWDGLAWTNYRKSASDVASSAQPVAPQANPYAAVPMPYSPTGAYGYAAVTSPVDPVTGQVPLWAPLYGASFMQAWKRFWRKYADFSGRASRSEFWFAYLGVTLAIFGTYLVFIVLGTVTASLGASSRDSFAVPGAIFGIFGLLLTLGYLAMIIPMISASVRRLHDAGYPGTYYLLGFIPFVGGILLIVFLAMESKPNGVIYDRPTA